MNYLGHLCSCRSNDLPVMSQDADISDIYEGRPCLSCPADKCSGFTAHAWRNLCQNCKCARTAHDFSLGDTTDIRDRLGWPIPKDYSRLASRDKATKLGYKWVPSGLSKQKVEEYMKTLDTRMVPKIDSPGAKYRDLQLVVQLPPHDLSAMFCHQLKTIEHKDAFDEFRQTRDREAMDIGYVSCSVKDNTTCRHCDMKIAAGEMAVVAPKAGIAAAWHPGCFVCTTCSELLVDLCYCVKDGRVYCERHYAEKIKARCTACDELIFSETTRAMNREWHSGHFACFECDVELAGSRYVVQNGNSYCVGCYESMFASKCAACKETICLGAKDLTYKELHWHDKCFLCCDCEKSLVGESFATQDEKLYCAECHDNNFATRCDFCKEVFRSGMKKFEWGGKKWHEHCFHCDECHNEISDHSFVPHEEKAVCVPCFERLYAPHCAKCGGTIAKSGITYKSTPWHRECFTCAHCDVNLAGEKFTTQDEKPYCPQCFGDLFAKKCTRCQKRITAGIVADGHVYCEQCHRQEVAEKCTRCQKPITGLGPTKFVTFEERHWHSECFVCHKCHDNLVGQGFLFDDADNIVCINCLPQ